VSRISIVATGTLVGLIAFLTVSVTSFGEQFGPLYLSGPSVVLGAFILVMGWLVAAYSARNLRGQARQTRYAVLLALAISMLWLAVVADPVAVSAAGWTISGLAIAGLVAHSNTATARSAAKRVALRLLVGDIALWAAVMLMVGQGLDMRSELGAAGWVVPTLLAASGVVRSALLPAWRWLPLTAEAPSPVSALLHAGVVNGMGLLAILWWPVFAGAPAVLIALVVIGGLTAVLSTAAMRVRPDVKGKLASSTSAQMGYMTVQVGLGLPAFAMLHLMGHGFYKAWLFLRAGGASRRAQVPDLRIDNGWVVVALGAAAAGVTALGATTWTGVPVVDLVPLVVAAVTATLALGALVWPDRRTEVHSTTRGRSWSMVLTLAGLFVYVVVLGVWSRLFEPPGVFSGAAAVMLTAAVLVFGGVGMILVAKGSLRRFVQPVVIDTSLRLRGTVTIPSAVPNPQTRIAVEAAGRTVGAMWPIHSAVAVNPLSGLQDMAFHDAAEIAGRTWGARSHMSEPQYAAALAGGRFTEADLVAAAQGHALPADQIADYVQQRVTWQSSGAAIFVAEQLLAQVSDERLRAALPAPSPAPRTLGEQAGVADKVSGLANAWVSLVGGSTSPWQQFQQQVRDLGLKGLRQAVQQLPSEPNAALSVLIDPVVPVDEQVGYLARLLARDPGWAAHLKQRDPALVADLLAIRAVFDVWGTGQAWHGTQQASGREWAIAQVAPIVDLLGVDDADTAIALAASLDDAKRAAIWQRAWEQRYRNRLIDRISARAAQQVVPAAVSAQLVMCIDVRSERFRRHAEAAGSIATFGFAGFFGVAIRHETVSGSVSAQCPVLLQPAYAITEADGVGAGETGAVTALRSGLVSATARPATAFAVAEGLGALAGADAVLQTAAPGIWGRLRQATQPRHRGDLHLGHLHGPAVDIAYGMTLDQRTNSAASMLRALGIVEEFAAVILLAGHAAQVENNAFAAAYDCGACGGNGGHVNARVMAAILNDAKVRRRLAAEHGISIPESTVAVPAWHNTTTDEVVIDSQDVPPSHTDQVHSLRDVLATAQRSCLQERMAELPGVRSTSPVAALRRANDWAEPQPEWGLAGNAAFVIGPRSMTKGLNLRGRVFLHSYEPGLDVDGSTLELLLTAPMVVTQWINNQYYFSTVDPQHFGAGDKTTHNVVGDFGVFSGAGGDLRVGLPWQGVYWEQPGQHADWVHEPLRLQVVVYAEPDDIVRVLDAHPHVAALVANEWIALAAIDPRSGDAYSLGTDLQWHDWLAEPATQTVLASEGNQ
jgi:uncharacterized protein YbcC (UPF0753/DUF2309 family)/NADH:ubiquinone oxidoreductase subunit 5 (subunit L)/multisubunit Na+/H+ antiporter MnhA subunit